VKSTGETYVSVTGLGGECACQFLARDIAIASVKVDVSIGRPDVDIPVAGLGTKRSINGARRNVAVSRTEIQFRGTRDCQLDGDRAVKGDP